MDEYIGQVLDCLEQSGLSENTIVIYQPDHGHSTETRAFGGGGNAGPYRGAKFSVFEGGIRVPSVVRYPKEFPKGKTRQQFMTSCDWFPTLCEMCQVELPACKLDGVSLVKVLKEDAPQPRESFYWQMGSGKNPQWAIREGGWKLIGNPRDTTLPQSKQVNSGKMKEKLFLVNLDQDPGEQTNLVETLPKKVKMLMELRDELVTEFQ